MSARRWLALGVLVTLAHVAEAAVVCRGKGDRLVVRDACRKRERAVEPTALGVPGPTGATGAPGAAGAPATSPVRIVDVNGTDVGIVSSFHPAGAVVEIDAASHPALLFFISADGFVADNGSLMYESADCSGTPFMRTNSGHPNHLTAPQTSVYGLAAYYAIGAPRNLSYASYEYDPPGTAECGTGTVATNRGTCCGMDTDIRFNVVPAERVLLSTLGLVPPFRAELR